MAPMTTARSAPRSTRTVGVRRPRGSPTTRGFPPHDDREHGERERAVLPDEVFEARLVGRRPSGPRRRGGARGVSSEWAARRTPPLAPRRLAYPTVRRVPDAPLPDGSPEARGAAPTAPATSRRRESPAPSGEADPSWNLAEAVESPHAAPGVKPRCGALLRTATLRCLTGAGLTRVTLPLPSQWHGRRGRLKAASRQRLPHHPTGSLRLTLTPAGRKFAQIWTLRARNLRWQGHPRPSRRMTSTAEFSPLYRCSSRSIPSSWLDSRLRSRKELPKGERHPLEDDPGDSLFIVRDDG